MHADSACTFIAHEAHIDCNCVIFECVELVQSRGGSIEQHGRMCTCVYMHQHKSWSIPVSLVQNLPHMSGLDHLKALKQPALSMVPVCMIHFEHTRESIHDATSPVAHGCAKPTSDTEMMHNVSFSTNRILGKMR